MYSKSIGVVYLFLLILISNICFSSNFYGVPNEKRDFISHPDDDEFTYVVLVGDAIEKVNSDIAIVDVLITTDDSKLSESIKKNNVVKDELINKLINNEIEGDNIKQSKFSTSPQSGWFGNKSFEVINRASITIKNSNSLNIIASIVDKYDEINIIDISFKHSEKDKYKAMVKEKAIEDVIIQKEMYEKLLDVKLDVISFYDTSLDKRFKNITVRRKSPRPRSPRANAYRAIPTSMENTQDYDNNIITEIYLPSFEEIEYKNAIELLCRVSNNK